MLKLWRSWSRPPIRCPRLVVRNSASGSKTSMMMTWASTRCRQRSSQLSAVSSQLVSRLCGKFRRLMGSFSGLFAFWSLFFFFAALSVARGNSASPSAVPNIPPSGSTIALRASSTMNVVSEMGGAFMSPSKCDADGNLYIRKYAIERPLLGPVLTFDPHGKRTALFDPAVFSQLALDRADAFSPASDGGMYQVAQSGVSKPRIYVLHFSSDGSPASPTLLEADFEVYTFAAFANGNY